MKFGRGSSLFATLTLALTSLLAGAAHPATADESPEEPAINLDITEVFPAVVEPGSDFTVRATITNNTAEPIADPRVALRIHRFRLGSNAELLSWAEAPLSDSAGDVLTTLVFEEPLEPGQSRSFEITGLARDLGLSGAADAWGPRGIAVELTDAGRRIEIQRTFLLWQPHADLPVNRVAIVAPLAASAAEVPLATGQVTADSYDDGSRLTQVLEASESSPAISWFVDPAMVAQAPIEWAEQLEALIPGRDILLLPVNDADYSALAHGDGQWLVDLAEIDLDSQLLANGRTDVAWPLELSAQTAEFLVAQNYRFAIVPPGQNGTGQTGSGQNNSEQHSPEEIATLAHITAGNQNLTLVQPNLDLQALLTSTGNTAQNAQFLLAQTALAARNQLPLTTDSLVLLPRYWQADPADFAYKIAAMEQASWLQLSEISTVLGGQGAALTSLPEVTPGEGALNAADLSELQGLWDRFSEFSQVLPDPAAAQEAYFPQFRALTSVRLREVAPQRDAALHRIGNDLRGNTGGLEIVPGSTMNLLAEAGALPIVVRNDRDEDATVFVQLSTDSRALEFPERVEVTIPANSQQSVQVPVRAFASIDLSVRMELQNADGVRISDLQELTVRVRADWESAGTIVITVILAFGLVAGIIRTIRRGQARTRQDSLEVPSE